MWVKVLDLVKQKVFCPYEYVSDFEKLKEELPNKEKFCSSLTGRKITDKEYKQEQTRNENDERFITTCI